MERKKKQLPIFKPVDVILFFPFCFLSLIHKVRSEVFCCDFDKAYHYLIHFFKEIAEMKSTIILFVTLGGNCVLMIAVIFDSLSSCLSVCLSVCPSLSLSLCNIIVISIFGVITLDM